MVSGGLSQNAILEYPCHIPIETASGPKKSGLPEASPTKSLNTHTHRDMLSRNGFRHGCHARRGHEYSRGGSGGGLGGEARFGDKGWQRTTKRLISHDFLWSLVLSFDFLVFSSIFHDFLAFSPLWCHQTLLYREIPWNPNWPWRFLAEKMIELQMGDFTEHDLFDQVK